MKAMLHFIKTTVLGGVVFLLPVLLVLFLIGKGVDLVGRVLSPVIEKLGIHSIGGVATLNIVAVAALLLVAFLSGMVARTRLGRRFREKAENVILRKVPGYTLFKGMARDTGTETDQKDVAEVALATIDDALLLCFIMEKHANGLLTVFVPSAPTPAAGTVYYLTEQQVRRIDVPVAKAIKCIAQLGVGSKNVMDKLPPLTSAVDTGAAGEVLPPKTP